MPEYQEEKEKAENVEKVENDEKENDGDGVEYDEEDEEEKEETKTEESEFKNEKGDSKEEKNDLEERENMNSREGKGVEDPREGVEDLGKGKENVAPLEGKESEDSKEIGMVGKDSRYGKDENSNDSPSKIQSQNVIPPTTSRTSPIKLVVFLFIQVSSFFLFLVANLKKTKWIYCKCKTALYALPLPRLLPIYDSNKGRHT